MFKRNQKPRKTIYKEYEEEPMKATLIHTETTGKLALVEMLLDALRLHCVPVQGKRPKFTPEVQLRAF
jgi:hypothetical protein